LLSALFYLGAKGMCKTRYFFLHFVPVDGVEYFPGICWQETYVFMFLCFQKTSLWTPSEALCVVRVHKSHNLNNSRGRIWGRIQEVGFLSFVRNPNPILPKLEAVEITLTISPICSLFWRDTRLAKG
jgi:hypothetical protein